MNLSPSGLLAHSRTEAGRRAIRYTATSLIGVVGTQAILQALLFVLSDQAAVANLIATMIMSVPAFILNKRWVWGKSGPAHFRREILPFWIFTVAGWTLSTLLVYWVNKATVDSNYHRIAVGLASIGGFGVLWVLKYLFLDKIMFGPDHHTPYDEDIEIEEAILDAKAHGATEV